MTDKKEPGSTQDLRYAKRAQRVISDLLRQNAGKWVSRKTMEKALRNEGVFSAKMQTSSARVEISKALRVVGGELETEGFWLRKDYSSGVMAVLKPDSKPRRRAGQKSPRDYASSQSPEQESLAPDTRRPVASFRALKELAGEIAKIPVPPKALLLVETRPSHWQPYTIYGGRSASATRKTFDSLDAAVAALEGGSKAIYACRLRHIELLRSGRGR